jgi:hypothetical protein
MPPEFASLVAFWRARDCRRRFITYDISRALDLYALVHDYFYLIIELAKADSMLPEKVLHSSQKRLLR